MSQHFLVELADSLDDAPVFACLTAPDVDTAITTFLTTFAPTDEVFLNYVYSVAVTFSFAGEFWIQTDAADMLFEQGQLQVSDALFAARVQHFFGRHHAYADLYLTYYFNADPSDTTRPDFPPAMLVYIWRHTGYGEISAIPIGEG